MTVQDIANAVSLDMRGVLAADTNDVSLMIPWVDRIHKDALHTSLYNVLIRKSANINVTQGVAVYTLSDSNVRRITSVYDRTFDRVLLPYENLAFPEAKGDAASEGTQDSASAPMLTATTMLQWPEYFMRLGSNQINLFPAPQKTAFGGTYEVYYETYAPTLAAPSDTLLIPDDGKDMIVAGVNGLASQYLKNFDEASSWLQQYQAMKHGESRP
jgi:hypothetical protein